MSTILNTNGAEIDVPAILPQVKKKFYVVTADWNPAITHTLRKGALEVLRKGGVPEENIKSKRVSGTVELINAAGVILNRKDAAAVIIIGCVIRGDTPHFDYVCEIAAHGTAALNARGEAAVIFGVLTVDNLKQAEERAGGALGNKGAEAAVAAIEMANLPYLL